MLLTEAELYELTGYKSGKSQIEWLRQRGWIFELNRLGRPKVDREYYRGKMGNQSTEAPTVQPNWDAIGTTTKKRPRVAKVEPLG